MQEAKQAWDAEAARAILGRFAGTEGPLLPMLHALQASFGCVPDAAVPLLAETLNLSRAEIHGVVSFYHDFRQEPAGRQVVKLCRAEACQAVGGEAVAAAVLARLGVTWGGTTPNGDVTVLPVYCLGLCACGPAALVDERPLGRITADALCAELA